MVKDALFSETQRFRQWWLWLILLVVFLIIAFVIFQIVAVENTEDSRLSLEIVGASVLFVLLPIYILWFKMKLETLIKDDGIYVRFFPFHLAYKQYKWETVSKCFVRQYNPIGEYGGWGLRFGPAGKAFNVSGNKGLQLEFLNNKKLLIGTNKPGELAEVLRQIGQLKQ